MQVVIDLTTFDFELWTMGAVGFVGGYCVYHFCGAFRIPMIKKIIPIKADMEAMKWYNPISTLKLTGALLDFIKIGARKRIAASPNNAKEYMIFFHSPLFDQSHPIV